MAKIKIDTSKCKGCCLCVAQCPRGNIRMSKEASEKGNAYAIIIDQNDCTGCALCCQICPDVAINIEQK